MTTTPDFNFEKSLLPVGCRYVLGIDEVGRGPWAGPVVVGAFLMDLKNFPQNELVFQIRDSKCLSSKSRISIFEKIKDQSLKYEAVFSSSQEIDKYGIQQTIIDSMENLLKLFKGKFDFALIDGNFKFNHSYCQSIVQGDKKCFSIAAASICAKVLRDQHMKDLAVTYPGFDFQNNMGYGTPKHLEGLKVYGPCPVHRRSFKPVCQFL